MLTRRKVLASLGNDNNDDLRGCIDLDPSNADADVPSNVVASFDVDDPSDATACPLIGRGTP